QGDQRRQRLDPHRAERQLAVLLVDRNDRVVVEGAAPQPVAVVQQQAIREAAQRQGQRQRPPRRRIRVYRGGEQRTQEQRAASADQRAGKDRQHQPLQHGRQHHQRFGQT